MPKLPKIIIFLFPCNIFRKKIDTVDFLHADKHESLLQIGTIILMGMVKHSQRFENRKLAMVLQYHRKKVRNGVQFLYADKNQNFYKLALAFLMQVVRHVQSTRNRKFIIFLQYIKKKVLQLLLCFIVMHMFIVTCFWVVVVKNGCDILDYWTLKSAASPE